MLRNYVFGLALLAGCAPATAAPDHTQCKSDSVVLDFREGDVIRVEEVCEGDEAGLSGPTGMLAKAKCAAADPYRQTYVIRAVKGPSGIKVTEWKEPICLKYED
jgi:hypothetical protein